MGVLETNVTLGCSVSFLSCKFIRPNNSLNLPRKYSTTEKLIDVTVDSVDTAIKNIVEREGIDQKFDPFDYIYNMCLNVMAVSGLGKK